MILSGNEIQKQLGTNIVIEPFDQNSLNSNSYNLRLHNELLVYEEIVLDMRRPNRFRRYTIPPEGFVLNPNQLYLGRTVERTETHNYVPMLEGRSSIGPVRACDSGVRRCWLLRILDAGDVRHSACSHLSRRADLPDLLSPGRG
jgi:hypothetical protein